MKKHLFFISLALIAAIFTFSCNNASSGENRNANTSENGEISTTSADYVVEENVAPDSFEKNECENSEWDGLDGTKWSSIDGPKLVFNKGKVALYLEENWGTPRVAGYRITEEGYVSWNDGEIKCIFSPETGDFLYGRVDDVAPSITTLERM